MQGKTNSTAVFDLSPALPPQHVNLEADPGRHREYGRWLVVGLVLLGALLFNGWQRQQTFDLGRQLLAVEAERASAEALGRHLRVEIAMLSSPREVESVATGRLHMVAPGRGDATVLDRLVPAPQPPSSVVALR